MENITALQEQLRLANEEIEALRKDKLRLTQELAKARGMLRAGGADNMSTKLKEALRE
ncbi:hypothetical protein A8990_14611 [Paenibacillus taihuensis]|uniref:Uncharacterized protein n=1 Tax=Paenibacillus taihuensis TaxID=1156355 RepID=A0A3D9R017_9BACL|nr:hypothetical protein [Paenibacillus taihuensis]REE66959.1 hypothetical protein A8990_14611 [Paenibacillus taihuensis]